MWKDPKIQARWRQAVGLAHGLAVACPWPVCGLPTGPALANDETQPVVVLLRWLANNKAVWLAHGLAVACPWPVCGLPIAHPIE